MSRDKLQHICNFANIVEMRDVKTRLGVVVGTNVAKIKFPLRCASQYTVIAEPVVADDFYV